MKNFDGIIAKTKKHRAEYDYISEYLLPLQKEG